MQEKLTLIWSEDRERNVAVRIQYTTRELGEERQLIEINGVEWLD
jgi:hypothetical protein